jgi:hypothetical protein
MCLPNKKSHATQGTTSLFLMKILGNVEEHVKVKQKMGEIVGR